MARERLAQNPGRKAERTMVISVKKLKADVQISSLKDGSVP